MNFISDLFNTLHRYVKSQVQTPYFLVFSIAQPIFWLFIFGKILDKSFVGDGISYIQFVTPGIIVMNVLYDAGYSGMSVVEDIRYGVFNKILSAPTNKLAIVLGNLFASAVSILIQVTIIYLIAYGLGFKFKGNIGDVLIMLVAIILLSLGVAGCSKALAFATRQDDPVVIIVNFITMPLIFLSTILLSKDILPPWAIKLSLFNPLEYAVRIVRTCCGNSTDALLRNFVILTIFAILGICLSLIGIRKTTN